jgi:hypothetical protein
MSQRFLTLSETCAAVGRCRQTVVRLADELGGVRLGGRWAFDPRAVARFAVLDGLVE